VRRPFAHPILRAICPTDASDFTLPPDALLTAFLDGAVIPCKPSTPNKAPVPTAGAGLSFTVSEALIQFSVSTLSAAPAVGTA
jgi:hypothetical protein